MTSSPNKGNGWYFGVSFDRSTGSILFENRTAAYDYMWEKSFSAGGKPIREVSGWVLNDGRVITLPYAENRAKRSKNDWLKLKRINDKMHVEFNDKWHPIYTHIHTHPSYYYFGDPGLSKGPNSDEDMFRRINVPIQVIYNGAIFEADYYYNNWRILKRWQW